METTCQLSSPSTALSLLCVLYEFQTLITGTAAIVVAIVVGIPVWRTLRDTNLQTRISHRETLAALLRDAVARYDRVAQSIREPLSIASRVTSDPLGNPVLIDPHDAHGVEQRVRGVLDWYLVVLADTEHSEIEDCKRVLRAALDDLVETLNDVYWPEHNDQVDEDHNIPDAQWAEILARAETARIDAASKVAAVEAAWRSLGKAQGDWAQSLRSRIAKLDLQIAAAD